ncbi:hypothetical protein RM553_12790 [Zunongwangia sp. F363]|uniref:Transposase n=1 Tax=Autumnicola tepida TaxID=3075595 RepID=A0ABU3CBJ7_9FLAO|nr:hypothetical protein [Zunongwangia sp. F363]MDT0643712.1 hypothetical protein [Zunongwangia sp. F363]
MRKYKNNPNPPMLNRAILELNGIFNVNPNGRQRQNNGKPTEPLQRENQEPKEQLFVHPGLFKEEIYRTMENYRQYIPRYNQKVKAANIDIKKYNKRIDAQRKKEPLTGPQLQAVSRLYKTLSPLTVWERNERIAEYNRCNGKPIARKEKIQTVKYHSEEIFNAILLHYSMQLQKRYRNYQKLNLHIKAKVPFVQLHSGWITNLEVNGVKNLDICNKTFRRQRRRLEEAGVLQEYTFEGSARPVKMRVNPEILCLRELHQDKKTAAENQQVTPGGRTELPHKNASNRSFTHKEEIKANVEKHSRERSSAKGLTSPYFSSIGNTREHYAKKNDAAPEKNYTGGQKNTLSHFLRQKLEEKNDFADQLAAHQHDTYNPIRKEILEKEAYSGSLSREEFKELVLQDFFKTAAKLWKNVNPYKASWLKAYNHWMQEKFITNAGHCLSKQNIVTRVPELRYGLAAVGRYLKRHESYNLLFPSEYFDLTRTTAKEGGFKYYAREAWRKHQDYLKTKNTNTKAAATKRKRRLSDLQKTEKQVKAYLKNKFGLQELFEKVEQIGNPAVTQDLPEIIRKLNEKHAIKYSRHEL